MGDLFCCSCLGGRLADSLRRGIEGIFHGIDGGLADSESLVTARISLGPRMVLRHLVLVGDTLFQCTTSDSQLIGSTVLRSHIVIGIGR